MSAVEIVFWTFTLLVAYVYFGYPALLWLLNSITGGKPVARSDYKPRVTLIVSAFNEERVIAEKIRNSLAIDYPGNLLEIVIVSDASDDGTDSIVQGYECDRVRLLRMPQRSGKTVGLNAAVKSASGDILIFSDANAMYMPDSVTSLLQNFSDSGVGAVVGESTYTVSANDAEKSESAYWRYETVIKSFESRLGSTVGGDGAIYAIRKDLYRPMAADALSDFVNPCQIVAQGKRCVYEPAAVSIEEPAGSFDMEFRRKVRIVNRAWRATMSMKYLLNPFRFGLFSFELISHKLLRWLVPGMLIIVFVSNVILLWHHWFYYLLFGVQLLFYTLALIGAIRRSRKDLSRIYYIPYYFCLVNLASACGIVEAYRGRTYTTWSTARTTY